MKIKKLDPHLNLFGHYHGPAEIENNTTRAFLCTFVHTPTGALYLRHFLDFLARRIGSDKAIKTEDKEALRSIQSPDSVDISLQTNLTSIETDELVGGIVVEIAPAGDRIDDSHEQHESHEANGIADGRLLLSIPAGNEGADEEKQICVLIESKLYGPAGQEQIGRYLQPFKGQGLPHAHVKLDWKELYELVDKLGSFADQDPLIRSFKEFLGRRPDLVPFIGFQLTDKDNWWITDQRLAQLCDQLSAREDLPFIQAKERKRGDADYDLIPLEGDHVLQGNLGIACWDGKTVYTKLVVGARTRGQIDYAQDRLEDEDVKEQLRIIADHGNAGLTVAARIHFSRYEEEWLPIWETNLQASRTDEELDTVKRLINRFHDTDYEEKLEEMKQATGDVQRLVDLQPHFDEKLGQDKKGKFFIALLVTTAFSLEDLAGEPADQQVNTVAENLKCLNGLLSALSR